VDRLEDVLPRDAELLLHDRDHLVLLERRHLVLQGRELVDELGRQQVRPRREHLAELRERRAELLERLAQPAGADGGRIRAPPVAQAVAGHDDADAGCPAEQAGREVLARPVGGHASSAVLTITTVQPAACETRFGTLPSRNWRRPRMPTLPTTTTSARSRSI